MLLIFTAAGRCVAHREINHFTENDVGYIDDATFNATIKCLERPFVRRDHQSPLLPLCLPSDVIFRL